MSDVSEVKYSSWFSELLKQLIAYSSVFAALSYLFGRSYYQGYFDALGVDISFIQLSLIEYLESGWLFLWATGMLWVIILEYGLFVLIIFNFIAPLSEDWAKQHKKSLGFIYLILWATLMIYVNRNAFWIFLVARPLVQWIVLALLIVGFFVFRKPLSNLFASWYKAFRANPKYTERLDGYFLINDRLLLQMGVLLIFISTLYFISLGATSFGKAVGALYLNEKAKDVEMISSIPIISNAVSTTNNVYVQDDLRLLLFNNGHYFLAKLNAKCKPQEVFVVDESNIVSIKMTQPLPRQICSKP